MSLGYSAHFSFEGITNTTRIAKLRYCHKRQLRACDINVVRNHLECKLKALAILLLLLPISSALRFGQLD